MFAKIMDAASKAVELDGTLSSAHAALAMAKLHQQWKWGEADQSFLRALQLDPGNSDVLHGYAHFLLWANRGRESAETCNRALALDPFDADLIALHGLAQPLGRAVRPGHRQLAAGTQLPEAISALGKAFSSTPQTASVAHALARSGREQAARDMLAQLLEDSKKKYVSAYDIAVIHSGLGDNDRALEWLNKAFDEHSGFMVYVYLAPRLKTLRPGTRFQDLLRRMGFVNQRA